jgi:F0F1-type ATP synthase assembly protein I
MGRSELTKRAKLSSKQTSHAVFVFAVTALDTTWRIFVPTLGGVFLGIGLDAWSRTAPVATIICLILGFTLSTILIIRQLTNVRKPL